MIGKVLIKGVSGFLGSHLASACLSRNWQVTGVANDLQDQPLLRLMRDTHPQGGNLELVSADFRINQKIVHDLARDCAFVLDACSGVKNSDESAAKLIRFQCAGCEVKDGEVVTVPKLLGPVLTQRKSYGPLMDRVMAIMQREIRGVLRETTEEFVDVRDLAGLCVDEIMVSRSTGKCKKRVRVKGTRMKASEIAELVRESGEVFGYDGLERLRFLPLDQTETRVEEVAETTLSCESRDPEALVFDTVKFLIEQNVLDDVSS